MSNSLSLFSSSVMRPAYYGWPAAQPVGVTPSQAAAEVKIQAEQYKNAGNEFRKLKMYPQAAQAYENAIRVNPRYTDAFYNLAHLMMLTGNTPRAISLLNQLLWIDPNDHDARVTLGEYYEKAGNPHEAKRRYLEILRVKPDFDPANRRLQYLLYVDQRKFSPQLADELMRSKAQEVIHKGRELLRQYYTQYHVNPVLLNLSQAMPIEFAATQQADEIANIAEYDARRNVIRVHPQMMFSTPNVVAAYLAHEMIHAVDGDSMTSIMEEQDGYRELARFWQIYQGAENEPNLDRALELYQKSDYSLDHEVGRVYSIRDAGIPQKSPGHGEPPHSALATSYQAYELQQKPVNLDKLRQLLSVQQPKFSGALKRLSSDKANTSGLRFINREPLKVVNPKTGQPWNVLMTARSGGFQWNNTESFKIKLQTEQGERVGVVSFDVLKTPVLYGEPLKKVDSCLHINLMKIKPEFRGKGLKEALVTLLREESVRLGFEGRLQLDATNTLGTVAAIPWYKAGFRPQLDEGCDSFHLAKVKRLLKSVVAGRKTRLSRTEESALESIRMYLPVQSASKDANSCTAF